MADGGWMRAQESKAGLRQVHGSGPVNQWSPWVAPCVATLLALLGCPRPAGGFGCLDSLPLGSQVVCPAPTGPRSRLACVSSVGLRGLASSPCTVDLPSTGRDMQPDSPTEASRQAGVGAWLVR